MLKAISTVRYCDIYDLSWSAYSLMIYITVYSLVMGFTE